MIRLENAHKAGRTDAEACILHLEPLDDPHACGNLGLEGFDESWSSRVFPNRGMALAWVKRQPTSGCGAAEVYTREWEGDSFTDHEYGTIETAEARRLTVTYVYPDDDGWRTDGEATDCRDWY